MEKTKPNNIIEQLLPIICTIAIVLGALGVLVISAFLVPQFGLPFHGNGFPGIPPESGSGMPNEVGNYPLVRFALSIINMVLVIYLLYTYTKDYLKLKTNFTLGIIAFLFSFLLYAIAMLPSFHLILGESSRAAFMSFVPMFFSAIGLILFLKLSEV